MVKETSHCGITSESRVEIRFSLYHLNERVRGIFGFKQYFTTGLLTYTLTEYVMK